MIIRKTSCHVLLLLIIHVKPRGNNFSIFKVDTYFIFQKQTINNNEIPLIPVHSWYHASFTVWFIAPSETVFAINIETSSL
jgi:hypothetical protein